MKKKVALLIPVLSYGGAERVVQRLSYILNSTFNLMIIVFDSKDSKYNCGCPIIDMEIPATRSILKKVPTILKRSHKLNHIINENNIDAVISFLDGANIVNLLTAKSQAQRIVSIRNYKSKEKQRSYLSRISDYFLKLMYNRADIIVPVSKLIEKSLVEDYNVESKKINVIYNPYDMNEITALALEELEATYSRFFDSQNIIISVGRMVQQKGFWHLVKAFSMVKETVKDARLVIIGDGGLESKLKKLIQDLKLEQSILLTGHQKNPFKFIKRSSLYVMTSLFEGFPNSLVEAMACGKPVISTDCKSGPREILYDAQDINFAAADMEYADYGILVPPLDEKENWDATVIDEGEKTLSEAIINVLQNNDLQRKYAEKSLERAGEFDYERCEQAFVKIVGQ